MVDDDDLLAAELALGLLNGAERDDARRRAGDEPDFASALAAWTARLAPLGDHAPDVAPPAFLWDRIARQVAAEGRSTSTIDPEQVDWRPLTDAADIRVLTHDSAIGRRIVMIRIKPGGVLAGHPHAGLEECFVLEGAIVIDGETIPKGRLHLAPRGQDHADIHAPQGALLLISTELRAA